MTRLLWIAASVAVLSGLAGEGAASEAARSGVYCDRDRYKAALAAGTVSRRDPSPFNGVRFAIYGTVPVALACALPIAPHRAFWRDYVAYFGCDAESEAARLIDGYIDDLVGRADEAGFVLHFDAAKCRRIAKCSPVTRFDPVTFEADFACWSAAVSFRPNALGADAQSPPATTGPKRLHAR